MTARDAGTRDESPGNTNGAWEKQGNIQVVEFRLGREQYAIDLFDVKEVVENSTITRLPNTPPYLKGVIDLRGEITTIVDLNQRLNVIADAPVMTSENRRIIVLDEKMTAVKTGIIVDEVSSVSTFEKSSVDRMAASLGQDDSAILGIIRKKINVREKEGSELVVWIDIRQILRDIGCMVEMGNGDVPPEPAS